MVWDCISWLNPQVMAREFGGSLDTVLFTCLFVCFFAIVGVCRSNWHSTPDDTPAHGKRARACSPVPRDPQILCVPGVARPTLSLGALDSHALLRSKHRLPEPSTDKRQHVQLR